MSSRKLETVDFYEFKLHSAILERDQAKMQILRLQVENANLSFGLAQEQARSQGEELKNAEQKLVAIQNRLREKYGIKSAEDVDWATGEIKEKADTITGNPGRRTTAAPSSPASTTPSSNEG